jgi:hypothetical protein
MINSKILVDVALSSNTDAYKASVKDSLYWGDFAIDTDYKERAEKWALTHRHEYRAIADTLIRLFPDHKGYIENELTALRIQTHQEYYDDNREVA